MPTPDRRLTDDPGPRARIVATVLLLGLTACALVGTDAWWPFSAWRLFSRVRTSEQAGWQATAVVRGTEAPIRFDDLPRPFHGAHHVLPELPRLSPAERHAVCRAWADALARRGPRPTAIRVYRTTTHLSLDDRPPVVTRHRGYECARS